MADKNKEIEFGVKIKNPKAVKAYLRRNSKKEQVFHISRDIYKNKSKYFIKISKETTGKTTSAVFSLKEDLLSKGVAEGLKVAEEIDVKVSKEQLNKLVDIVRLFSFKKKTHFKKTRYQYQIQGVVVTVDEYDGGVNLEVEGSSQDKVTRVVKQIPYEETTG